jgi:hypothetical protein
MILELPSLTDGTDGRASFPLFDADIDILVNGSGLTREYADACAAALDDLDDAVIDQLCQASDSYRLASEKFSHSPTNPPRAILSRLAPLCLTLSAPDGPGIAFSVELNADWAPEHGLEWSLKNDHVIYVGPSIGASPWDNPSEFDPNFA